MLLPAVVFKMNAVKRILLEIYVDAPYTPSWRIEYVDNTDWSLYY